MRMLARKPANRRPVNVTLDTDLVKEAKEYGINVSQACEGGLLVDLIKARKQRWIAENKDALESNATWFEENGLPFADLRVS